MLLLPVLVAAVGVTVSLAVRPVLVFRYLVPTLSAFPVFAAVVLGHMFHMKTSRKLAAGILSIILIAGGINYADRMVKETGTPENSFNKSWVEQQDCDLYLVMGSLTHGSTVLGCFEEDKTIYTTQVESGEANPFPNIRSYESFCPSGKERIILLTDEGEPLLKELSDEYSCSFKEQIVEGDGCVYDVYELVPYNA